MHYRPGHTDVRTPELCWIRLQKLSIGLITEADQLLCTGKSLRLSHSSPIHRSGLMLSLSGTPRGAVGGISPGCWQSHLCLPACLCADAAATGSHSDGARQSTPRHWHRIGLKEYKTGTVLKSTLQKGHSHFKRIGWIVPEALWQGPLCGPCSDSLSIEKPWWVERPADDEFL